MAISRRPALLITTLATIKLVLASTSTRPCTVCPDGTSTVTLPDKILSLPPLPPITCKVAETSIQYFIPDDTSDECKLTQSISTLCGCPKNPDACSLCPDGSEVSNKDIELPMFDPITPGSLFTCELMEAYLHSFLNDADFCPYAQQEASEICGCPKNAGNASDIFIREEHNTTIVRPNLPTFDSDTIRVSFFGATSNAALDRLHLVELVAAILSIVGALVVIQDNVWNKKRRSNLYNQIITVMALFDIIQATATALQDTAAPSATSGGTLAPDSFMGNQATCKAQGWAIQFGGLTSLFLNASLSTYFLLVIVYRSKASQLKQLKKWLLGLPILVGFIFACSSLPFITLSLHGCHLTPPNAYLMEALRPDGFSKSWAPYLCLYIIPAFSVLLYTTGALGRVFVFVRRVSKKADRWRFNTTARAIESKQSPYRRRRKQAPAVSFNTVQNEVFWQSAMYLCALYLAWFTQLIVLVQLEKYLAGHYSLWVFFSFITPLQGFMNALVYFRPRIVRTISKFSKQAAAIKLFRKSAGADDTEPHADQSTETARGWSQIRAVEPAADIVQLMSSLEASAEAASVEEEDDNFQEASIEGSVEITSSIEEGNGKSTSSTIDVGSIPVNAD